MMAAHYRHTRRLENRLGRHYKRFRRFAPAPPLVLQLLVPKNLSHGGPNRRSSVSILSDQKSRDPRIAKPSGREQSILAITPRAIESALWLSLYGFADIPNRQMDGAYHRSCIVSELHNFDRVIVCRPLANGWSGERGRRAISTCRTGTPRCGSRSATRLRSMP